jgi:hypothetical protein
MRAIPISGGIKMNKDKIILDLCGGTGAWSRFYQIAGFQVYNITLPDFDVTRTELLEKAILFVSGNLQKGLRVDLQNIYGILAAPPCTEFSFAKNGSHRQRDLSKGLDIVKVCLDIIWHCRLYGNLKFWALENPVGYLRQFLGIPKFQFEQWEFGENKRKKTDIWGYFNEPRRTICLRPVEMEPQIYGHGRGHGYDWTAPKRPAWLQGKVTRQDLRSITPEGFALAFYEANK